MSLPSGSPQIAPVERACSALTADWTEKFRCNQSVVLVQEIGAEGGRVKKGMGKR